MDKINFFGGLVKKNKKYLTYEKNDYTIYIRKILNYKFKEGDIMANTQTKKSGYFSSYFKSIYVLFALLFASVAMTAVLLNYKYETFSIVFANKPLFAFLLSIAIILFAVNLIYLAISIKSSKVSFADALGHSILYTGIILLVYSMVRNGVLDRPNTVKMIIMCVALIVIGLIFVVARVCKFGEEEECSDNKRTVKNYYKAIINKYSFMSIIIVAIVLSCISYFITNFNFRWSVIYTLQNTPLLAVVFIIAMIATILWVAVDISRKNVNVLDIVLAGSGIALVTTLAQVLTGTSNPAKLVLVWLAVVVLYLLLTLVRYINFRLDVKVEKVKGCFVKNVLAENGILFNVAVASLIVAFLGLVIKTDLIALLLPRNADGVKVPVFNFFPVAIVLVACLGTLLISLVLSITTLYNKKDVQLGDHFLVLFTAISLLSLLLIGAVSSTVIALVFIGMAILSITLLVSRARNYKELN